MIIILEKESSQTIIYIISDSTGETAQNIINAAISQFETDSIKLKLFAHIESVKDIKGIIEKINPSVLFARVLPSLDSIQKCLDLGLKQENIIAMQGTFSKNFNKALMEEYNISLIITKESGETGGTPSKINAALELGINIVLVTRPKISELNNKDIFTDLDEITDFILK